jgi:hypothetical protein
LGPDGGTIPQEQTYEIQIFDDSTEVTILIAKASELINSGENQQAMELLGSLI